MKTIFLLLLFFLSLGVLVRSDDRRTHQLLSAGILLIIVYLYLT